jgi:Amt family ammonium transporter
MNERDRFTRYNPVNICNGLLAGLVSITASCNNVENYSAFVIGLVSGFIYIFACRLFVFLKIDDPCCASQIHGICGAWGVIALGFFDRQTGLIYTGNFT